MRFFILFLFLKRQDMCGRRVQAFRDFLSRNIYFFLYACFVCCFVFALLRILFVCDGRDGRDGRDGTIVLGSARHVEQNRRKKRQLLL